MSVFTDAEIEFVNSQRLGRVATVGAPRGRQCQPVEQQHAADHRKSPGVTKEGNGPHCFALKPVAFLLQTRPGEAG
jgi:hypothetical protein